MTQHITEVPLPQVLRLDEAAEHASGGYGCDPAPSGMPLTLWFGSMFSTATEETDGRYRVQVFAYGSPETPKRIPASHRVPADGGVVHTKKEKRYFAYGANPHMTVIVRVTNLDDGFVGAMVHEVTLPSQPSPWDPVSAHARAIDVYRHGERPDGPSHAFAMLDVTTDGRVPRWATDERVVGLHHWDQDWVAALDTALSQWQVAATNPDRWYGYPCAVQVEGRDDITDPDELAALDAEEQDLAEEIVADEINLLASHGFGSPYPAGDIFSSESMWSHDDREQALHAIAVGFSIDGSEQADSSDPDWDSRWGVGGGLAWVVDGFLSRSFDGDGWALRAELKDRGWTLAGLNAMDARFNDNARAYGLSWEEASDEGWEMSDYIREISRFEEWEDLCGGGAAASAWVLAGIGLDEAAAMVRTGEVPDQATLEVMAALLAA